MGYCIFLIRNVIECFFSPSALQVRDLRWCFKPRAGVCRGISVTMKEPSEYVGLIKSCWRCHSSDCRFSYFDNKKQDQPRYKCLKCKQHFALSLHASNHPKNRSYTKKLGDLVAHLARTCPLCGAGNDGTKFLYYNNNKNKKNEHPRFRCFNCKKDFQTHVVTPDDGGEPYLESSTRTRTRTRTRSPHHMRRHEDDEAIVNRLSEDDESVELDREIWSALLDSDTSTAASADANGEVLLPEYSEAEIHPDSWKQELELVPEYFVEPEYGNQLMDLDDIDDILADLPIIEEDTSTANPTSIGLCCPQWDPMPLGTWPDEMLYPVNTR